MKKTILNLALALGVLTAAFVSTACTDNSKEDGKVEVTNKYYISFGGMYDMSVSSDYPVMVTLKDYAQATYRQMEAQSGKAEWTITVRDVTTDAANKEADRQAVEVFNSMITKLNAALDGYKTDFEKKRGELAAQILACPSKYRVRAVGMTPTLYKEIIAPTNAYFDIFKEGDKKLTVEAIGGAQY